jgi:hypothetical protein
MRCVLSLFGYSGRRDEIVGAADPLIVASPALLAGAAGGSLISHWSSNRAADHDG